MIRTLFALGMIASLVGAAVAQAPNPNAPKPAVPRRAPESRAGEAGPAGRDAVEYIVEFKLLEGTGLFNDGAGWRDAISDFAIFEGLRELANLSPEEITHAVSALAAVKNPAAIVLDPAEREIKAESVWSGIKTVAAPRVVTVANQPVTVQVQSSQRFSYLEPLGDGKYQARATPSQSLGMKIMLTVQSIAGDDAGVELSPLQIATTALDGREPVEGLDLDVGKPIISTRSLETTAKMKLGETRMIAIPSGPKTRAALLLRVKRSGVRSVEPSPTKK